MRILLSRFHTSEIFKGYFYGISYIISVAASTIWLNTLGRDLPLIVMLFYTSIFSILIINIINFGNIKTCHRIILEDKLNWLGMSVALIFVWYFTYYSTIHSSAEFYISIVFLVTALLSSLSSKNYYKLIACLISIGSCYLLISSANIKALLAAVVAGFATFTYYKFSFRFSQKNVISPIGVLSIRFYLVLLMIGVLSFISGDILQFRLSIQQILTLLLLSTVNMVFPMIFCQSSFQKIGVEQFAFLTSFIPALTFLIEFIIQGQVNLSLLILCLILTITLNSENLRRLIFGSDRCSTS